MNMHAKQAEKAGEAKPATLREKLLMFQRNIGTIQKDGLAKAEKFSYKYATLPQILAEVKPQLTELGLILMQPIRENKVFTIIQDSESGEQISSDIAIPGTLNAQGIGSAITYFRRYGLAGLLALEIEDDDAHTASNGQVNENDSRPWLNAGSVQYTEAVKYLAGGNSIEKIEGKYRFTKKTREGLLNDAMKMIPA